MTKTYEQCRDDILTNPDTPKETQYAISDLETLDPHHAVSVAAMLLRLQVLRARETPSAPIVSFVVREAVGS
tara:strand:- start:69 stop:284 length:216 start_codon:yes stop_codon:yes gene_type:complete